MLAQHTCRFTQGRRSDFLYIPLLYLSFITIALLSAFSASFSLCSRCSRCVPHSSSCVAFCSRCVPQLSLLRGFLFSVRSSTLPLACLSALGACLNSPSCLPLCTLRLPLFSLCALSFVQCPFSASLSCTLRLPLRLPLCTPLLLLSCPSVLLSCPFACPSALLARPLGG